MFGAQNDIKIFILMKSYLNIISLLLLFSTSSLVIQAQKTSRINDFFNNHYTKVSVLENSSFRTPTDVNFSINEGNLVLKYKEVFPLSKQGERTMTYNHTCIFDLYQATIYSGFWSNSYLGGYQQYGEKNKITIKCKYFHNINIAFSDGKTDGSNREYDAFYIECLNDNNANELLGYLKDLQKPYKALEPWESQYMEAEVESSPLPVQELFDLFSKDFCDYEIKSEERLFDSGKTGTTKITKLYYKHPFLTISYIDSYKPDIISSSSFKPGKRNLTINITRCKILKRDFMLKLMDEEGIDYVNNGSKTIKTDYSFSMDKLVLDKICTGMLKFKNKVIETGFNGTLISYPKSVSSKFNKNSKQDNQFKNQKISKKYGL